MQTYQATITEIIQETLLVKLLRLTFPEIKDFSFIPGQFVMIGHPELKSETGVHIERAFSLASAPHQKEHLELCVKIVEGGRFSSICKNFTVGENLSVKGPFGKFCLPQERKEQLIFLAAGTGIAPLMSMLRHLANDKFTQKTTLFFTFREPADFIYRNELEHFDKTYSQFTLVPTCTSQNTAGWEGLQGRFTLEHLKERISEPASQKYYLCGNNDFVKSMKAILAELGVPREHIATEAWG